MTPAVFVPGVAGVLGLAIGSFLNVVAYRVPAGISLLRESRCPDCDSPVAWRNIPVLGWLLVGGKCVDCRSQIPVRYPLVEASTGLGFAAATALWWHRLPAENSPTAADWVILMALLGFLAVGIVLALIDLDTRRLPDVIVLPGIVGAALLLTLAAALAGAWDQLGRAAVGAAVLWAFYAFVRFVRPDGMGGGDVKLALLVGGFLGWLGWGALAVGAFAAFVLGGVVGIALVATRGAGRRTALPFGPWILAGAWVGIAVGETLGSAYWRVAGL